MLNGFNLMTFLKNKADFPFPRLLSRKQAGIKLFMLSTALVEAS